MSYALVRAALFHLDAEAAHEIVTARMVASQDIPLLMRGVAAIYARRVADDPVELWGLRFRNRLGMAAGFDKNAQMVPFLRALGFGFVEVGTVTLHPQPGNPRPRLFRYPRSRALINRLGFNNDGAIRVADRLRALRESETVPVDPLLRGPVFVNIGKNRDVALSDAVGSYGEAYRILASWAEGVVINVSSPNTPGLRDLQSPEHLERLLLEIRSIRSSLVFRTGGRHPVLVKIAPDVDEGQLAEIAEVCVRLSDGMVATNTTLSRDGLPDAVDENGGLSGHPLFERSTAIVRRLRELTGPDYPLVGVGGVFSSEEMAAKLEAGADLVQAYTGFVYVGPSFAIRLLGRRG